MAFFLIKLGLVLVLASSICTAEFPEAVESGESESKNATYADYCRPSTKHDQKECFKKCVKAGMYGGYVQNIPHTPRCTCLCVQPDCKTNAVIPCTDDSKCSEICKKNKMIGPGQCSKGKYCICDYCEPSSPTCLKV